MSSPAARSDEWMTFQNRKAGPQQFGRADQKRFSHSVPGAVSNSFPSRYMQQHTMGRGSI